MGEVNHFKNSFKFFKQKQHSEVLHSSIWNFDFHNIAEHAILARDFVKGIGHTTNCASCERLGLVPHQQWHIYFLRNHPGFFYIRNPFTIKGQQLWIRKCLEQYPQKPSVTNLDLHYKGLNDIWSLPKNGQHKMIDKLSWTTLGYNYNWDTKMYDSSKQSIFPECLADLVVHIASCLNFATFRPEAAIISYYNSKSSLGIHDDHSEQELNEPIISLSFGLSAIFLIGTESKIERPTPVFLRNGDIVILSGPSRLSYHAVPAVVNEPLNFSNDDTWAEFHEYIKQHRINISVRQVYSSQ